MATVFYKDSLSGTPNTLMIAHTPDLGGAYSVLSGSTSLLLGSNNRLCNNVDNGASNSLRIGTDAPDTNIDFQVSFQVATSNAGSDSSMQLIFLSDSTFSNFLLVDIDTTGTVGDYHAFKVRLFNFVSSGGGTFTSGGEFDWDGDTNAHNLKVTCRTTGSGASTSAAVQVWIDGGSLISFTFTGASLNNGAGPAGNAIGFRGHNQCSPTVGPNLFNLIAQTNTATPVGDSIWVAPGVATAYTATLSSSGAESVGVPDTITFVANGTTTAVVTPTVHTVPGSLSASTVTLNGTTPVTLQFTPSGAASGTISFANSGSLSDQSPISITATVAAPTISPLVQDQSSGGVRFTWTATGATSYAVHRSPTAPFTPSSGTLQATVSTLFFSDPAPLAGEAYYRVVATGAGGSTTSVQTDSTYSLTWTALQATKMLPPMKLMVIGMSITAGLATNGDTNPDILTYYMNPMMPTLPLSAFNVAAGGSTAKMWYQGLTAQVITGNINSLFNNYGTTYTFAQLLALTVTSLGGNPTHALIDHSINDASNAIPPEDTATFMNYIHGIVAALPTGCIPMLSGSTYVLPNIFGGNWDEVTPSYVLGYRAALKALDGTPSPNGSTYKYLDHHLFEFFQFNPHQTVDGVHPSQYNGGKVQQGSALAASIYKALFATSSSGTTTSARHSRQLQRGR